MATTATVITMAMTEHAGNRATGSVVQFCTLLLCDVQDCIKAEDDFIKSFSRTRSRGTEHNL